MRSIESHSPHPLNRIDHKKCVDHNKDTDKENFEQFVPLIPFANHHDAFWSYKVLISEL
jgi:hypothetical protein